MELAAGIAAVTNAITIAKTLKKIEASYDLAKLKSEVTEIYESLSDAKMALIDAREALAERDMEIERLRGADKAIDEFIEVNGFRYRRSEGGDALGWPACPTCIVKDKHLTVLVQDGDIQSAKCPRCNSQFNPVDCYSRPGNTLLDDRRARQQGQIMARGSTSWMA